MFECFLNRRRSYRNWRNYKKQRPMKLYLKHNSLKRCDKGSKNFKKSILDVSCSSTVWLAATQIILCIYLFRTSVSYMLFVLYFQNEMLMETTLVCFKLVFVIIFWQGSKKLMFCYKYSVNELNVQTFNYGSLITNLYLIWSRSYWDEGVLFKHNYVIVKNTQTDLSL